MQYPHQMCDYTETFYQDKSAQQILARFWLQVNIIYQIDKESEEV